MTPDVQPALDLTINRIIRAPRRAVWAAWSDPRRFEQWWIPAPSRWLEARGKGFMTAIITLRDHPDGTDYAAHAMHKNPADRNMHAEMGFHDGWGTVIGQLAAMVER